MTVGKVFINNNTINSNRRAGDKQDDTWLLPVFYFKGEVDGIGRIACKEVSGLEVNTNLVNLNLKNYKT